MRETKEVLQLECDLTDKERMAYGRELAAKLGQIEEADGELKRFKDTIKSKLSTISARVGVLSRAVDTGKEFRNIMCSIEFDWKKGEKRWVRRDTKKVVKVEGISDAERQEELKFKIDDAKSKKATKKTPDNPFKDGKGVDHTPPASPFKKE